MMDGKENGNTTEYVNTRVNAKDTLTLSSGNDTVLSGAQALGNRIVADVGNNLTLTSLQDIDNYQSKQTSVSGGFSFTFGTMTGSANLSVSKSKTKSEYASVGDQSGLFAGDAGYDLYVGNHTQLNGAVIASTAGAANNALSTGTLGWSAIENAASYKASSYSAGGGFSVTEQKDDQGNVKKDKNGNSLKDTDASPTMPFAMSSSGSASGTTNSAVSAGTITVRNGNAQQQNVSELSRDTDTANGSIGKIFDKDKVASDMELAKGITELAGQFSSDLSRNKVQDAKAEAENRLMLTSDKYRQATPAERASMLADDATYHEQIKTWGVGGTVPMAITAVTAAFSGITAGNLGAAASGAMAPYIARQIKAATGDNVIANAMAHAVEGAVLAQMAGNSATAGAVGSAGGELIARSIVATLYPGVEAQNLTEEQKHIVSALSQISSGILGGLEGNSVASIATAQIAGKNAVENNDLSLPGGMMSSIDAAGSWNRYAEANGLTLEQKEAGLHKLATGDLPEGANIPKVIINGYKDGVLIAGAAYLGPAASIGKAVGGAIIAEIANGSYQWFDLNQPGNESKGWDYWGSASAGITGALAPGRGVWKNVGIAAGGAVFTDGPDVGAVGGAALGALAGGFFGELAPFPGEMNDLFGGIGGEVISNKFKDKVNDN
jgi:filamentous hemagglutinin